jgi:hypothetical protein
MTNPRPFYSTCVDWCSVASLEALEWLCENADDISLDEFRSRVHAEDLASTLSGLGYEDDPKQGLTIEQDHHVSFMLERKTGIPFMVHSAIEFVFAEQEDIDRVMDLLSMEDDFEPT